MDIAQGVMIAAVSLGLIVWVAYRLLRWARSGTGGAQALGAVLTEVTQSAAVLEAKKGKKVREGNAGDPPAEE
jgi:ABC-type uncharacterized transport system permease subunit